MQPRLCFDFCRQHESARFFGIVHGRECYCSPYFHVQSTGGQGVCNLNCEGDAKEMCGGPEKSSLFEMHQCGDSADEASLASQLAKDAADEALAVATAANDTASALHALAGAWQLGVCSADDEGERICALRQTWLAASAKAIDAASVARHEADKVTAMRTELESQQAAAKAAGQSLNASLASSMELLTSEARDAAASTKGKAAAVNMTLTEIGGPLLGKPLASFGKVYQRPNTSAGWFPLCALVPIQGQAYAALAQDDPATCADRCLSMSTGVGECVGFNYQYMGGLAACQLLSGEGLVKSMITMAVPVFEVTQSKISQMGLTSLSCYISEGWMAGHPRGPLKASPYKIREVTSG